MYVYFILPINGLMFGAMSVPVLQTMLNDVRSTPRKLAAGVALQALVLFVNLALSSALGLYTGNLAP
jgi:hypothetical protein